MTAIRQQASVLADTERRFLLRRQADTREHERDTLAGGHLHRRAVGHHAHPDRAGHPACALEAPGGDRRGRPSPMARMTKTKNSPETKRGQLASATPVQQPTSTTAFSSRLAITSVVSRGQRGCRWHRRVGAAIAVVAAQAASSDWRAPTVAWTSTVRGAGRRTPATRADPLSTATGQRRPRSAHSCTQSLIGQFAYRNAPAGTTKR